MNTPIQALAPEDVASVGPAQAYTSTKDAIDQWIESQRAQSEAQGMWDPVTGMPTAKGLINAAQQYGGALVAGTSAPGVRAFHGSPHDFEAFDASKIGTGEGAQAYGHGMYLAENEGVARGYRDALTPKFVPNPERKALENEFSFADTVSRKAMTGPETEFNAAIAARNAVRERLANTPELIPNPSAPGHMYEVNVNADPERFLHWDKPLSEQHPDVQKAMADRFDLRPGGVKEREAYLASLPNDELRAVAVKALDNPNILGDSPEFARLMKDAPNIDHNAVWDIQRAALHPEGWGSYSRQPTTMGDIYRSNLLGEPADASAALRDAGIPGIRYLDQGSRDAGEGTSNYVVFDPATIEILRKYGIAGLIGAGAAAGQKQ